MYVNFTECVTIYYFIACSNAPTKGFSCFTKEKQIKMQGIKQEWNDCAYLLVQGIQIVHYNFSLCACVYTFDVDLD